jgi:hypothetical protein
MLPFLNAIVTILHCIYLMKAYIILYWTCCLYLMVQSYLWQIVHTRSTEEAMLGIPEPTTGRGQALHAPSCWNAPPPPPPPIVSIEQLFATQNDLMRRLVENDERRGVGRQQYPLQQDMDSSYSDFLGTHPPLFSGVKGPLEVDNWLRTTESKFNLLHCTEYQKTLYAA